MDRKRPEIDVVVFDIGNVLVSFEPAKRLRDHYPAELADALARAIFTSPYWRQVDQGCRPVAEILQEIKAQSPDLADHIDTVVYELYPTWVTCKEDTVAYLPRLRQVGYRMYLLSNYNADFFHAQEPYYQSFLCHVDGVVLSGEEKMNKPDAGLYRALFDRYQIDPERAVFYDDVLENVEAARALGMRAVVFQDARQLEALLDPQMPLE